MNIHEEAQIFIEKTHIGKAQSTIRDNLRRLNEAVNIFIQNSITNPTEADFENILRPAIAAKGKKAGEQAQEKTILRTLNLRKRNYNHSNRGKTARRTDGFLPRSPQ